MRLVLVALLVACSSDGRQPAPMRDLGPRELGTVSSVDLATRDLTSLIDAQPCQQPPNPAGPEVALGPDFAASYAVYALGAPPGVPSPLGGLVVSHDDPNTLLMAGESEQATGTIYAIKVQRDGCNHILGFVGSATRVASAPYLDANLVYGPAALLVYTEWPQFTLSQLAAGATTPSRRTDLKPLGIAQGGDMGPGGIGFVPPGMSAAGQLRIVTWPEGHWYHVGATLSGGLYTINSLTQATTLANNPGGFAYVPAGSPGFTAQSLIVAEWNQTDSSLDRVAVYEVDDNGDPKTSTRREFLTKFPRPWGAYFEPLTGDYFFLTWGAGDDRVYLVQGFVPPAPVF
jgi:hypothetical protein